MRRTTQWAVFTSMNQRQPMWRSMVEPADRAATDGVTGPAAPTTEARTEPESAAPETRPDRVDFM